MPTSKTPFIIRSITVSADIHTAPNLWTVFPTADIFAGVIQGSALGPASFIVTASDLQPAHQGNVLVKFADDTYVIVPAANSSTCERELSHVQTWAEDNNLKLNCTKSKEIIFTGRGAHNTPAILPPPCLGISQVHNITTLGVVSEI